MTDALNYQTPSTDQPSGRRTAAWIASLVLGILYCLGGFCAGFGMAFTAFVVAGFAGKGNDLTIMIAVMVGILLVILSFGSIFIWAAVRVRRGSYAWGMTALVLSAAGAVLITLMVVLGVIGILIGGRDPQAVIGMLLYILPALANAATAILLFRALGNLRRPKTILVPLSS